MSNITIRKESTNVSFSFKNGYTVSIFIGPNAYCSSGVQQNGIHASNAEIAIIDPDGEWHRIAGQADDVVGWVSPEQIVEIAYRVACGDMDAVAKILKPSKGKEQDNDTRSIRV